MKERHQALRMCVVCREMQDKRALLRVVKSPTGEITVDESGKAQGRGAYLCRKPDCLTKAQKSRALERALKSRIEDTLYQQIAAMIAGEE